MRTLTTYVKATACDDKGYIERKFENLESAINYANNDKFGKYLTNYTFYNTTLYVDKNGQVVEKDTKIKNVKR